MEPSDCLGLLKEAAERLKVGELIYARGFQLGSALAAIEIMDPRMDTGMLTDGDDKIDVAVHDSNSTMLLSHQDLSRALDRLLLYEASWLDGQSLSETLFAFKPLHDLSALDQDGPLKIYCRAVHFTIRLLDEIIQFSQVFYEEDINLDRFGISIGMFGFHDIQSELREVAAELSAAGSLHLANHFKLRMAFLEILEIFSGQHVPYATDLERLSTKINEYLKHLEVVFNRQEFNPIEECFLFDDSMFRKLSTRAPPRKQQRLSNDQSFQIYHSIGNHLLNYREKLMDSEMTLFKLLDLIFRIPSTAGPAMNIVTRSLLMILTCCSGVFACQYPIGKMIRQSIQYYTNPPYFASNSHKVSELLDEFLNESTQVIEDSLMPFFRNSSRVHRALPKIIALLDSLQAKTEDIDSQLQQLFFRTTRSSAGPSDPYYLANWVYAVKLRFMERMLTLGLELDIYSNREFVQVYWYLDFLYGIQIQNYNRVCTVRKPTFKDELPLLLFKLKLSISRGLLNGIEYLRRDGFLSVDDRAELETAAICFANRFRAFMRLGSPQTVSYENFLQSINTDSYDAMIVLNASLDSWGTAKQMLNLLKDSRQSQQEWFLPELFQSDLDEWKSVVLTNEVLLKILKARREQFQQQQAQVLLGLDKSPRLLTFKLAK